MSILHSSKRIEIYAGHHLRIAVVFTTPLPLNHRATPTDNQLCSPTSEVMSSF